MKEKLFRIQQEMAEARSLGLHRRAFRRYATWRKEWEALGRPQDESWHSAEIQKIVAKIALGGDSEEIQIASRLRASMNGNVYLEVAEEEQSKQDEQDYRTWWQTWFRRRHEIDEIRLPNRHVSKIARRSLLVAGISTRKELELFQRFNLLSDVFNINTEIKQQIETALYTSRPSVRRIT